MKKKKIKKVIGTLGEFVFRNNKGGRVRNIPLEDQLKILDEARGENWFPEMNTAYPQSLGPVSHKYNVDYVDEFDLYDVKLTVSELEGFLKQVKEKIANSGAKLESVYFNLYEGVAVATALETDEEFQARQSIVNAVKANEKERKKKIKAIVKKLTDEEMEILGL